MRDHNSNSNFNSKSGWSRNKKIQFSLAVLCALVVCSFVAQEAQLIGTISTQAQAQTKTEELIHTEILQPNPGHVSQQHRFLEALRKMPHYRARTANRPTVDAISEGFVAIPPSKMKVHYHALWNYTTSTIEVPDDYQNPFNVLVVDEKGNKRRPRTSLEILQSVLHGTKYKAEFAAVEAFMESSDDNATDTNKTTSQSVSVPKCLRPEVEATRDLANHVVQARPERSQQLQQIRNERMYNKSRNTDMWPFAELMLPLPILNVGFPKVGTNTLRDYLRCTGLKASHNQEGKKMVQNLANNRSLFKRPKRSALLKPNGLDRHAYTQLDREVVPGYFPQISLLDELHELEPDSTFVLLSRPIADWIHSMKHFDGMLNRMYHFDVPGIPRTENQRQLLDLWKATGKSVSKSNKMLKLTNTQVAKWWCGHVLHIREYVKEYPSHSLIELDLYDTSGTESLLYDLIQVDTNAYRGQRQAKSNKGARSSQDQTPTPRQQCFWGHSNQNSKIVPPTRK